jgi:2-polyprenyl-3-methyl-5-hydroxy-6-metoxy-1,4-benzoquinol methylase
MFTLIKTQKTNTLRYNESAPEPTIDEIAYEWNQNVPERAYELESRIDNTYLNIIVPYILNKLGRIARPQSKILDIGCGLGHLTNTIAENGYYNIVGIDIAQDAIDYAKDSFPLIKFEQKSIIEFSNKNRTMFDICIVNMVLHNLGDIEDNLSALYDLLQVGGYVIASIPDPEFWFNKHPNFNKNYFFEYETQYIYKIPFKIRSGVPHPSYITYFHRPVSKYNQLIKRAGFKLVSSGHPKLHDNREDQDLLFCLWQKP